MLGISKNQDSFHPFNRFGKSVANHVGGPYVNSYNLGCDFRAELWTMPPVSMIYISRRQGQQLPLRAKIHTGML